MDIKPHELRIITELCELAEKVAKLDSFIDEGNPYFTMLDKDDQRLLRAQWNYMLGYKSVLKERVNKIIRRLSGDV